MLTLEQAKSIADEVRGAAIRQSLAVSIAIVDAGAHPVYFERMNEAIIGSVEAGLKKARSAVLYQRSTKVFEEALASGRSALLSLPDAMPIEGGLPIARNGVVIGGIGVSGGSPSEDGALAQAGVNAISRLAAD
jgi:glc operon protein GlcG